MAEDKYTIGLDFGTDSVRSVIVNAYTGQQESSEVFYYPRWKEGKYCNPDKNQFRQHPRDYLEGLEYTIKNAVAECPEKVKENIVAVSIDTTGSTPVAVDENGTPLSLKKEFAENPNAMFVLWKDHTAVKEAAEINQLARSWHNDYTKYEGGVYSSEWFWAKILHIYREDDQVRTHAFSWVEHCDWIPAILSGNTDPLTMTRSRCAAGHKAMWHPDWDGLPPEDFLTSLDSRLEGLRNRLYKETYTCDTSVGTITQEWAEKLGLPADVVVGAGAFDAHLGAIGGEIKSYHLSKVMGTSTCDMLVVPEEDIGDQLVEGIAGQVNGSIIPGMIGMEAGQSAFGDIYAWFKEVLSWPLENILDECKWLDLAIRDRLSNEVKEKIIPELSQAAENINPQESSIIALDWMNGRRTPYANQELKGAITGLTLGSDAPKIFRALVESTAYGAKKIVERFQEEGVEIHGVIALGGVAKKSPFVMQLVADVLNMPIQVAHSEQTCALGSAMAASVVANIHPTVEEAQKAMGQGFEKVYEPNPDLAKVYEEKYVEYNRLGDYIESST